MNTFPGAPDPHALAVILLTALAIGLFSLQRIPLETSGLAVLTLLVVGFQVFPYTGPEGPVNPVGFLAGFGNPALVTVVALLVCSKALDVTGALHVVARRLGNFWARSPRLGLLATLFGVAAASMFMNNTPLVAMVLPVLVAVCLRTQTSVTGVLMPVGFATSIGGMATTIGTSTNLLVADIASRLGLAPFGMFDFTLPVVLAGSAGILLLWLIGPKVLPERSTPSFELAPRIFHGVLHVTENSPAAGRTLSEIRAMTDGRLQLERVERGDGLFIARLPTLVLRPGDRLYVRGDSRRLKEYERVLGTPFRDPQSPGSEPAARWMEESAQQRLAEIVVTSASPLYGQTLAEAGLLERYGLSPIAVHAPGSRRFEASGARNAPAQRLRIGDVVLVQGDASAIDGLKRSGQVLVLDSAVDLPHTARAGIAVAIMAGVVLVAALGLLPILVSALVGVVACIATRCLHWQHVRSAIDTNLVVLIVATLAIGDALMETGATGWIANVFVYFAGDLSPGFVIAIVMLVAAIVTEIVTNNAVAILMTPMAFSIGHALGLPVEPLVLAVMFGANLSFLTPIGYQTNLMVMNAGGYRFTDFTRLGLPLQLLMWTMLSWLLAQGVGVRG